MGFSNPFDGVGNQFLYTISPAGTNQWRLTWAGRDHAYFSDLSLYLMGLIPSSNVGTHTVFQNQNQPLNDGAIWTGPVTYVDGHYVVSRLGERIPDYSSSQKAFRVATILVTQNGPSSRDMLTFYDYFASRASLTYPTKTHLGFPIITEDSPFYVATGGRAIMTSRLDADIKPAAEMPMSITVPASDIDGQFAVSWEASKTGWVSYTLQEATNAAFTTGLRTAYTGSDLSVTIKNCPAGTYYYRVKATKDILTDSGWQTGKNGCAETAQLLSPPTLSYSTNGPSVTIRWTTVPDASGYTLYYAPYPYQGPQTIGNLDMGSQTSFRATLPRSAAFYVAVVAKDRRGSSEFSNIELFRFDSN